MKICNISEAFAETADRYPDRVGLIVPGRFSEKRFTLSELSRQVDSFAAAFVAAGVARDDRVLLMVRPSMEFICLAFALFKIGAPVILIDPGMGCKNLLRSVESVRPTVFIGIPQAQLFRKYFAKFFQTVRLAVCVGWNAFGFLGASLSRLAGQVKGSVSLATTSSSDLAAIIFTTGSTGPPKGVRYEHGVFQTQLELIRDYYQISSTDIDQPAFPLFALFSIALGACVVIPQMDAAHPARVNPARFIRTIEKYNVTYSFGSPAIWNVVSNYCLKKNITLKTLRMILMAGAPVSGELIKRVKQTLPDAARIHTPYGATESLPVASISDHEILVETWEKSRKGAGICVGRPLPGLELAIIRIIDAPIFSWKEVVLLPPGEIGEIVVKGGVVTRGYEGNDLENDLAKIADADGFRHRMGDVGYLDQKGRLWFCGRKAHRVQIENDQTMYTIPCEAIFNEHPAVYRSALVGVPASLDAKVQTPVLIVELNKKTAIGKEFIEELAALARAHEHTIRINHFLIHPAFPVDIRHNAKIFREKLAVWAASRI